MDYILSYNMSKKFLVLLQLEVDLIFGYKHSSKRSKLNGIWGLGTLDNPMMPQQMH